MALLLVAALVSAPPAQAATRPYVVHGAASVAADGSATGNGNSSANSGSKYVSADGRYVAFASLASNLVADDTNNAPTSSCATA